MVVELEERVRQLEATLRRLIRIGIVTQVYPDKGTVRVKIADEDEVVSYELPVLFKKTQKDKDYWMPDIGEHVMCLFLPFGQEQGFVIGAFYSEVDKVPVEDKDVKKVEFENGAFMEWNRKTGTLRIFTPGEISIVSGTHIVLIAPRIDLNP